MPTQVNNDLGILNYIDVPFVAGDYTAKGSMTWTVTSARSRVAFINNTMWWWLGLDVAHSVIGGSLDNQLFVKVPFSKRVTQVGFAAPVLLTHADASSHPEVDICNFGDPDNTHISLIRPLFTNFVAGGLLVSIQPIIFEFTG